MSENSCRLFKRCGGCQLKESYAEQLEWKQSKAERMLSKFAPCERIIGMKKPYNYRNKVQHGFYTNPKRQIISGIFQSGSGKIVPCENCMLEDVKADKIISTIRILMRSFKIFPYNPNTGKGIIRHVMIRKGHNSGEYLVCLVTATAMLPSKNNFTAALLKAHPCITTVVQNICDNPMPLTMGEREIVLYGKGSIEDTLCGKHFGISARSFYQVNPVQTEVLYRTAMELAQLKKTDRVLDCYCGTGTIGIIASDFCKEVTGVEINESAVADAKRNAEKNNCKNVNFICGDSGEFMRESAKSGEKINVVFTDPPRTGSDRRFLESLGKLAPERIVYISCGIESLERDLKALTRLGYTVSRIQPVDMFPHTKHVETVVLLSHKEVETTIDVKLEFGEGKGQHSLKKAQAKADKFKPKERVTYKMIQEYVENKYGFKVHTAYIAEVKRSLGLEMYDAPNAVETLKNPRKHPTLEKIKAIKDALKYFEVI